MRGRNQGLHQQGHGCVCTETAWHLLQSVTTIYIVIADNTICPNYMALVHAHTEPPLGTGSLVPGAWSPAAFSYNSLIFPVLFDFSLTVF